MPSPLQTRVYARGHGRDKHIWGTGEASGLKDIWFQFLDEPPREATSTGSGKYRGDSASDGFTGGDPVR